MTRRLSAGVLALLILPFSIATARAQVGQAEHRRGVALPLRTNVPSVSYNG